MTSDDKTRIAPDTGVRQGTQLNGIYEIDEHIATGGMGEVYRGHNIQTGDPVAIKVVLRELARDQGILALFRKEASILNHLSHDAIVRYHVFTIDPTIGRPYLAMEFVDGQSLAERMRQGALNTRDARKMLARVASGLALAHEAGVIHRDLSPDNIVLPGGSVEKTKIIDFGIARSANVGGGTLLGGSFAGKYSFVSPEQLGLFGGEVTERSDIYSLGLVLAAALRGKQLDMGGSPVEVIEKRRTVPDLAGVDPELLPLLEAMLQPDPADRPQSADEIVEWLRQTGGGTKPGTVAVAADHEPVARAPEPSWRTSSGTTPGKPQPPPPESLLPRDAPWRNAPKPARPAPAPQPSPAAFAAPRRGRTGLIGGLLLVAAVVAGGAYLAGLLDGLWPGGAAVPPGTTDTPVLEQTANGKVKGDAPAPQPQAENRPTAAPGDNKLPPPIEPETARPSAPVKQVAVETKPVPASAAAWFKSFDGGPCFYAAVKDPSAVNPAVDGFATSKAPMDKLARDFSSSFAGKLALTPHIIERDQCPVADFLDAMRPDVNGLTLQLNKNQLKVGDSLQGTLTGAGGRDINLLLIGKDGVVYNFANLLKRSGSNATFSMKLFPLSDQEAIAPEPHLIVALASDGGLRSADIKDPELAIDLFPRIRTEAEAQRAAVALGYFQFGK
ncbi:serine/threonine-protein kinase [Aminobacter sp. HY435]|uniref:serine/threonine-protein kinase n=1 Tax=Aminobacter sp. HY435 TaxID=2970917 RepID=UPI0022B9C8D0|nr:serine/threonine-protein kinase [Aminobacter sp. HY435]